MIDGEEEAERRVGHPERVPWCAFAVRPSASLNTKWSAAHVAGEHHVVVKSGSDPVSTRHRPRAGVRD